MIQIKIEYPSQENQKRASISGSKINKLWKRGSMTIEAALAIPLFLFAVLCLVYLLEIQTVKFSISAAAYSAAKNAAEEIPVISILNPVKLKADIVNAVGSERLERSIVEGGSSGLHCWTSYYDAQDGIIHMRVNYRVRLPLPGYTGAGTKISHEFDIKAWTGYQKPGVESEDDTIVYITDTGVVYHINYQCPVLQLSIQFVPYSDLAHLRNEDGGRYHACEKCVHGSTMAGIYVTNYGNKYHNSLNCSGLKRSIRAVRKSEVAGRRECSRCGS